MGGATGYYIPLVLSGCLKPANHSYVIEFGYLKRYEYIYHMM